jgi:hypothetical protein
MTGLRIECEDRVCDYGKMSPEAGRWWLTPVIPATQEAEIRRIMVPSQPQLTVCDTLS